MINRANNPSHTEVPPRLSGGMREVEARNHQELCGVNRTEVIAGVGTDNVAPRGMIPPNVVLGTRYRPFTFVKTVPSVLVEKTLYAHGLDIT